jgi:hypothetical protein
MYVDVRKNTEIKVAKKREIKHEDVTFLLIIK